MIEKLIKTFEEQTGLVVRSVKISVDENLGITSHPQGTFTQKGRLDNIVSFYTYGDTDMIDGAFSFRAINLYDGGFAKYVLISQSFGFHEIHTFKVYGLKREVVND